jgi:hypothetical protein
MYPDTVFSQYSANRLINAGWRGYIAIDPKLKPGQWYYRSNRVQINEMSDGISTYVR